MKGMESLMMEELKINGHKNFNLLKIKNIKNINKYLLIFI